MKEEILIAATGKPRKGMSTMGVIKAEQFVYPKGHNWEGLTPEQVNEGYAKYEKEKEKENKKCHLKD